MDEINGSSSPVFLENPFDIFLCFRLSGFFHELRKFRSYYHFDPGVFRQVYRSIQYQFTIGVYGIGFYCRHTDTTKFDYL